MTTLTQSGTNGGRVGATVAGTVGILWALQILSAAMFLLAGANKLAACR